MATFSSLTYRQKKPHHAISSAGYQPVQLKMIISATLNLLSVNDFNLD